MKRKILVISVSLLMTLSTIGILTDCGKSSQLPQGHPFQNLKASDIASATVQLLPPDTTIQINDLEELADLLKELIIYNRDDSYKELVGAVVKISLSMNDGSQLEIMECNPILVIDGIGYRTKYEPCEALDSWAFGLIQ